MADLKKNQVEPLLFKSVSPTGRVLSVITPDAQRSMFTFLGASSEAQPEEITKKFFANAAIDVRIRNDPGIENPSFNPAR